MPMGLAEVTVVVENLRSADGDVRIALWSNPVGFTDPKAAVAETGQKAQLGQVTFTFSGLPPGRYAIASFHDENGNGAFDRTLLGLPKEGLGFSNGARINLGPPTFEAAAVEIAGTAQVVVVELRY
ncbi:MAG TPA: DUF2141 domain-containing protein [Kiloniellales bacterium]